MIDLHSHILYDIDDGSRSLDMSLAMLRLAEQSGTTDIIATPHVNRRGIIPPWKDIVTKVNALRQEAQQADISIRIHCGAEVELNYAALQFLKDSSREYCLAGSRYILVEMTNQSQPEQAEALLYELMLRDYVPVLAHPERYDRIMAHPDRVLHWMQSGVLTQCNGDSFRGFFGKTAQKRAEMLLAHDMVTFLGSDAHRLELRNTDLSKVRPHIDELAAPGIPWQTWTQNAQHVLENKLLYSKVPDHWKQPRRSFLARLFSF